MYGNTKGPKPEEQAKRRVAQTKAAKKMTGRPGPMMKGQPGQDFKGPSAPVKRNLPARVGETGTKRNMPARIGDTGTRQNLKSRKNEY